jgi:hypothetical protein
MWHRLVTRVGSNWREAGFALHTDLASRDLLASRARAKMRCRQPPRMRASRLKPVSGRIVAR